MARSLSIGSPLLNTVRGADYPFVSTASKQLLTLQEIAAMSVLSPRVWAEVMTQASGFAVMVSASPLAEIRAAFLVKTTFLIMESKEHCRELIEFSKLLASQLLEAELMLKRRIVTKKPWEPVLVVSTLPATFPLDRMLGRRQLSAGWRVAR